MPGPLGIWLALGTALVGEPVEDVEAEMPRGAEKGVIPAIREPAFDDGSWLSPADEGVGVVLEGRARFYPLRVLEHHEAWWTSGRELTVEDGSVIDADGRTLELLTGRLGEDELAWAGGLACYWLAWTEFAPGSRLWHETP